MSDAIEEIQSERGRQKGLEMWAEMLHRMHARGPAPEAVQEASAGGSSRLPRDHVFLSNPKLTKARATQPVKAERPVAEPRDTATLKQAGPPPKPRPAVPLPVAARPQQAPVAADPALPAEVLPTAPPPESGGALPFAEGSKEAGEQRVRQRGEDPLGPKLVQMVSQAGVLQPKDTQSNQTPSERALVTPEEAALLASLKSGAGANPELAAKNVVLARDIPGVQGSLQGGIYEDYRVAL